MDYMPLSMVVVAGLAVLVFQVLPLVGLVWALVTLQRIRSSQASIQHALTDIATRLNARG